MTLRRTLWIALLSLGCILHAEEKAPPPSAAPVQGAAVALPPKERLHLYLLIGQSNMAGRGKIEPKEVLSTDRLLKFTAQNTWAPATEPLHTDKPIAGVGLGSSFGRAIAVADPSITVGLIPCAVGGTPLSRWCKDGDLYKQAVVRAKLAMKDGTLCGILWHQGENDASKEDTAHSYADRLSQMVADLRAELGAGAVPFVAGKLGEFLAKEDKNGKPNFWPVVNEQIATLPQRIPNSAVVESKDLKHKGDGVHFDTPSLREFGRRYAAAMSRLAAARLPSTKAAAKSHVPEGIVLEEDVVFGTGGGRELHADIAYPKVLPKAPMPAVVMVHGGGWSGGTNKGFLPTLLLQNGYFLATIEYRLSGEAPWPAQIEDCKLAVRWLRANAAKYHINPDRIGCMGHSAGGHLVACMGTLDLPELEGHGGYEGVSSQVQAVVDEAGPTNFTPSALPVVGTDPVKVPAGLITLFGGTYNEKPDIWNQASPSLHVSKATPPFLILHGEKDHLVPIRQAEFMLEALKTNGIPVDFVRIKNGGHGLRADKPEDPPADPDPKAQQTIILEFFDRTLKK